MKTVSSCFVLSLFVSYQVFLSPLIDRDVMETLIVMLWRVQESQATEESGHYSEGKLRHEPSNTGKASTVGSASVSTLVLGTLAKTSDTQLLKVVIFLER